MDSVTSRYYTSLQSMEPSPFTAFNPRRWGQGMEEEGGSSASPRFTQTFSEIEQMWEDKWHGASPVEGAVESMMQERTAAQSGLFSSLSLKSRTSQVIVSLKRLMSKGRAEAVEEGFKPSGSGPCEAFADWPIPPYPDNHEWDD